ncbi:MAG: potassium-transporting ATPase subunit KdpA [Coxiellaceae bacterium]|jgi:K+-transporting ATPase ATPase A chain|nr:potassium-transporting ATPase subunit KdpA [Coxiellaceae bacterium]
MLETWLLQITSLLFTLTVLAFLLGEYMAKVFTGEHTLLSPIFLSIENFFYKIMGIDPNEEMTWQTFAIHLLIFTCIGIIILFVLLRTQDLLPLNPENFKAIKWDSAINTAISFVTNTNWQAYNSEANLSYLTRMLGLSVQNFLSAAVGMAVGAALINAFVRKTTTTTSVSLCSL